MAGWIPHVALWPLPLQANFGDVMENGNTNLELQVPFPPGARVTVFVMEEPADDFSDLITAAQSSLELWDNPDDDEDWNKAS